MAETAQTMTEFTYAPGEQDIVGDRFSPSVIIFWLKTSIAASSTRVQYRAPRRPTACSSNSRCSPTSRRKPHNRPRLRRSPIKRSRASDVVRKQKEDRAEKSKTALSFRLIR